MSNSVDDVTVVCVGAAVLDYVFSVDTFPSGDGKSFANGYAEVGGGPAATGAVAVARLGGRAILLSRVGRDRVGDLILSELADEAVDVSGVLRLDGQSTVSAVLVDKAGRRMIINHRDPNLPRDTRELSISITEGADAVLADLRWPEAACAVFERAVAHGKPCILDADSTDDAAAERPLSMATHIVFSRPGLTALAGLDDPVAGLQAAERRFGAFVAVTDGENGCTWMCNGAVQSIPAFKVDTLDTTGAGDVFHGAFALAIARGMNEGDGLRLASAAAALKCTKKGGRAGIPNWGELADFLRKNETWN